LEDEGSPRVRLRPVVDDDFEAIAAIYGHAVRHGFGTFEYDPPDAAEMRKRGDVVRGNGLPYYVAEEAGRIVGYSYASTYRPRPGYRFSLEDSVYTHPECGRRGIGRALLTRVIADCEKRGYRQLLAVIGDSLNKPSIALHTACGFRRVGALPSIGHKHGRWVDTVLMQLALGPGDTTAP